MAGESSMLTTVGECAAWSSGGTPFKGNPEFWGGDIPWVSAKDMKQFRLYDAEDHITVLGAANGTKLVPPGTILVLIRGMTLHNDVPICVAMREMAFNQDVKALIPRSNVDSSYLAYWLLAHKPQLLALVDSASHGTGRIHADIFKALELELPPLRVQKAIAHILGTLDDKIELNRRMNETLEAMARSIFRSWFVDFDPVRAKMDGRKPEGMDAATARLFPDDFEESELGPIPLGWRIRTLKELTAKIGSGATPRGGEKVYLDQGVALVRSQNVYDFDFRWDGLARIASAAAAELEGVTLEPEDVLFNITGASILRTCVVDPDVLPARVNQHVARIRACSPVSPRFLHLHLVREEMKDFMIGFNAGATREAVTKGHIESIRLATPPKDIFSAFDACVTPIYCEKQNNLRQIKLLASVRDSILPKLLSGQIRIDDPKRFIRECAT